MNTKLIAASFVALMLFGCNSNKTENSASSSSEGLFGKAAAIKVKYEADYDALKEKAKTEVKSADDLVKINAEMNTMQETAKKEFSEAVASMKFPIDIPFVDSTDGKSFKVQSVQVTEMQWDVAKVAAKVQVLIPVEKTMGGQVMPKIINALMVDKDGKPLDAGQQSWFTLSSIKDYAVNDTVEFTNAFTSYVKVEKLAKLVIKDKKD